MILERLLLAGTGLTANSVSTVFKQRTCMKKKKIDKKQTLEQMFTQECTQVITQVITQISLSLHVKYSNVRRTSNLGFLTATSK